MNVSLSLLLCASVVACVLAGCWGEEAAGARTSGGGLIEARGGSALAGFANLKRRGGTWKVFLNVVGAPPGDHAVRLHRSGDCTAFDASSVGPVWNAEGTSEGAALGELGTLHVGDDGRGLFTMASTVFTLGDGGDFDLVGRPLVISSLAAFDHQQATETGVQGDTRIGCGVIR